MPSVKKGLSPEDYSASDLRYLLESAVRDPVAKQLASFFVGKENISQYMSAIGLIAESKKYSMTYMLYND